MQLVEFRCPTHGLLLSASPYALVECGECGTVVDAEGRSNRAAWTEYRRRGRVRRHRARNRFTRHAKGQVRALPVPPSAPQRMVRV